MPALSLSSGSTLSLLEVGDEECNFDYSGGPRSVREIGILMKAHISSWRLGAFEW